MIASRALGAVVTLTAALLPGVGCAHNPEPLREVNQQVTYYEGRVAREPRLYPAYALLGAAYLDKARLTHDPAWLARSREALARSQKIQSNFDAMKSMAAVCNYAHRFNEAMQWLDRAAGAMPEDSSMVAMRVEALMALGRTDEARRVAENEGTTDDFYYSAARGQIAMATGQYDEAKAAFLSAARAAETQEATSLQAWALIMAAGSRIDSGRAAEAKPLLEAARRLEPDSIELGIHDAEVMEAEGRAATALDRYAALARPTDDPSLHARAFALARELKRERQARQHFDAAERGFQKAIDAGEVYTLEALASLYLEAGASLDRAEQLARENLNYKKDRAATELLEQILAARGKEPAESAG